MLSVSLYPEPALPKDLIREIAREAARRGVEVSWKMQDKFTCLNRAEMASLAEAIFAELFPKTPWLVINDAVLAARATENALVLTLGYGLGAAQKSGRR